MLKLTVAGQPVVPVRLIPFVTGWQFPPDEVARILQDREGFHRVRLSSMHIQPDGTARPMLPKEWDVIAADLEILTTSLKAKETVEDENYPQWREEAVKVLPAGTFVWLRDLEAAWGTAYSPERAHLLNERAGDRKLNLEPFLPKDLFRLVYEGFDSAIAAPGGSTAVRTGRTIRSGELLTYLGCDPYYGVGSDSTETIVSKIYADNAGNTLFEGFRAQFSTKPCKSDRQRELLLLWCELMGLTAYRDGRSLERQGDDFVRDWAHPFELNLDEVRDFLRQHSWPLPSALFRDEADNTERKVVLDDGEYSRAAHQFTELVPQLKQELEELLAIQPGSLAERAAKKAEIDKLERRIAALEGGVEIEESPTERKERLKGWFEEECTRRGERGALTRTAKREGIKPQTLSAILKRAS